MAATVGATAVALLARNTEEAAKAAKSTSAGISAQYGLADIARHVTGCHVQSRHENVEHGSTGR